MASTDKVTPSINQGLLRELLDYDPVTGTFRWRMTRGGIRAGSVAGGFDDDGYRHIRVNRRRYRAHRLAWYYMHGTWPDGDIDHINGVPSDNRIDNLREASRAENLRNTGTPSTNTSGLKGATWHKASGKWRAQIVHDGQQIHLGLFRCKLDAHEAYKRKAKELHGEFAHHSMTVEV